jgi:hypothetical protein
MQKIFRIEEQTLYRDLRSFFLAWRGVPVEALRQEAHLMVERVVRGEEWDLQDKADFLKTRGTSELFVPFLEELSMELERRLPARAQAAHNGEQTVPTGTLRHWNELIRSIMRRWESYNQAPDVMLETLYYSMVESMLG